MLIREARPSDAAGIARVQVDTWRTTYAGIVPADYLAGLSYERNEQNWLRGLTNADSPSRHYVAETDDGQVVGFVAGGPKREGPPDFHGELYAIYVLKEFQGQGLGRGLVGRMARGLLDQRLTTMQLWVLRDNAACRFYEALGGARLEEKTFEIGGAMLVEVAYGWSDIGPLVKF